MYEVQGWFRLWFSFDDDEELDREAEFLPELQEFAQRFAGSNVEVRWPRLNGSYFLTIAGYTNRPRTDSDDLHTLLTMASSGQSPQPPANSEWRPEACAMTCNRASSSAAKPAITVPFGS
ncbi:hypothetical protein E0H73_37010 [Kribbella pittospori]|uniref:Uncharacterized protein n=1 Tax=Kribbella pittospori TaxID=722689 RepID=A0A4R0KAE9_9ACTN|nr:Imm7 family immunity protein [Kribbella pittospori]TCC55186.1 hypothetical protein E0H73_37010 [Kribbella pittospori]